MRIIAVFEDQKSANQLIDSLKINGYNRKDMIVTNVNKFFDNLKDDAINLKTEEESLVHESTYVSNIINKYEINSGILVILEAPESEANEIMQIMKQNNAIKIVKD